MLTDSTNAGDVTRSRAAEMPPDASDRELLLLLLGLVGELVDAFNEYQPVLDHFTKTGPVGFALRRAANKKGKQ